MKIEISNKKIFLNTGSKKTEIHPIWLRERVNGDIFVDKKTDQRLFDPSFLKNIKIKNALIDKDILQLNFNDGAHSKYNISKLASEFFDDDFQSVTDFDDKPVASSKVSVKELPSIKSI